MKPIQTAIVYKKTLMTPEQIMRMPSNAHKFVYPPQKCKFPILTSKIGDETYIKTELLKGLASTQSAAGEYQVGISVGLNHGGFKRIWFGNITNQEIRAMRKKFYAR